MKKNLLILTFLFSATFFGADKVSAQTAPEKVLFVELFLPDGLPRFKHKFEVPDNFNFEESLIGGGFATTGCLDCLLASEYSFFILKAERISGEKLALAIDARFINKPRCNTNREIFINPNKRETVKLKCGVKITTYSALPDKSK